jgi:hypothetical protein
VSFLLVAHRIGYHHYRWPVLASLGVLFVLGLITAAARQSKWAAGFSLVAVCSAGMVFALYKSSEEQIRSAKSASPALAAYIPAGEPIITRNVLWSQPELFYYARRFPTYERPLPTANLPNGVWLALDDDEWAAWHARPQYASHLSRVFVLHPYKHIAYLCWYSR